MIRMGIQSGLGIVEDFEKELAYFLGVKHVIGTSSGTMADTIALAILKNKFPDKKKVLVPALTFIAQINSIIYNGLEPVFLDIDKEVEFKEDYLCYFPVHLLGVPAEVPTDIPVIEDACEAFGSKLRGKYCGTIADMGTFSFYNTHTLRTGEGGAIVTNDDDYADMARILRNHGSRSEHPLEKFKFDVIGFNGKMSAESAKIGLENMKTIERSLEKRHENYLYLGGKEKAVEYIVPHGFPAFYSNRDSKMVELFQKGIDSRKIFSCIPTQEKAYTYLGYEKGDFPKSELVGDTGLYVPCHENLTKKQLELIKANL